MNRNLASGAVVRYCPPEPQVPFALPEVEHAVLWAESGSLQQDSAIPFSGHVTPHSAHDFQLSSPQEALNAMVIRKQEFSIANADICLSGCGCSDFTCKGAGVLADQHSDVVIEDSHIETHGCARAATTTAGGSTLKVYRSTLDTTGGPLPPDYTPVIGPGMMEPPAPLGLGGNCRTHLSMDNSETFFYDCHIKATAWAALSTDASGGYVYLEANHSRIDVSDNGYCVYSDNGCHVKLKDCAMTSGNMAVIQDGNSSVVLENSTAVCQGIGFLLHGGMPEGKDTGLIRLQGGSLESKLEMFRCKSTNVDIYVDRTALSAENGILLRTMVSDDPFYYKTRSQGKDLYGVQITLDSVDTVGDMVRDDLERTLRISLDNASLTGAILGGADLYLYGTSRWFASKNSTVTLHTQELQGIDAPAGVQITAIAGPGTDLAGVFPLPSGGVLSVAQP